MNCYTPTWLYPKFFGIFSFFVPINCKQNVSVWLEFTAILRCIDLSSILLSSSKPPTPRFLTGLSDVDQAEQVHQLEEHDHQADDADSLESLRLPSYTHISSFIPFMVFWFICPT